MPLISICIPTFNGGRYLGSCLQSALAQSVDDLEVVINDDASEDDTLRIANEFAQRDSRIHVHSNARNLGLIGNWNRTIERAKAPWIKLLFQDDTLHQDCLAELHGFSAAAELPFVACLRDISFDDSVGAETRTWFARHAAFVARLFHERILRPDRVAEICLDHFALNFVGEPIVTLLHKRVFDEVGYFDPALAQRADTEFWARAGLKYGVGMVDRPLATFRLHRDSTSSKNIANRRFVDERLDTLVILHRYLFDQAYALVRHTADRRGALPEMNRSFDAAVEAVRLAAQQGLSSGQPGIWEEWRRVVAAYPGLDPKSRPQTAASRIRSLFARMIRRHNGR